jgi:hypothetical protein
MTKFKKLGLVGLALLAVAAFVGASSASAAQWLDNSASIGSAEATTIVDDGNGLTLAHTGGLGGSRSLNCHGTAPGTAGPGGADTSGAVTVSGCTNINNCTSPSASSVHSPWNTTLVSLTEDDITSGGSGNPGWGATCSGITLNCTKATTAVVVSNTASGVDGQFTATNTSAPCADGGTGTVVGHVEITLNNSHVLSVG